ESGHALQDAARYPLLGLRSGLVPLASIGSSLGWIVIAIGFAFASMSFVLIGIAVFSATVLFQVVDLPVGFYATRRARVILTECGLITSEEDYYVKKVLSAAALTYVAATLSSILTLLYFLYRAGLLGGRRN